MRLRFRAAGVLALAVVAITCSESTTGPGSSSGGLRGRVSMVPEFSPAASQAYAALHASAIDVTEIHVLLTATGGSTRDTVIAFPIGTDLIHIEIDVPASSNGQQFTALLELRAADHTVLFSGTQVVTARPSNLPALNPPVVAINYSGPGKSTKTVTVAPPDTTVSGSPTLVYIASGIDSGGKVIPSMLVSFTSSDPTVATVTSTGFATASVKALGERGVTTISASTPLNVTGSSKLSVVPPATKLVVISGSARIGVAGTALALPLVIEAQAADNLPVTGTPITFRAVTTGGSVALTTPVIADATGRATMVMTLGKTSGTYQYEAAAPTLTPVTVSETATPAPAVALALVSGSGQTDVAGRTLGQALVVKATDQFGGPAAGATVNWARVSGNGSVSAASTTTASDGTTSISYTLGAQAGTDVVSATLANVSGSAGTVQFTETSTAAGVGHARDARRIPCSALPSGPVAPRPSRPVAALSLLNRPPRRNNT